MAQSQSQAALIAILAGSLATQGAAQTLGPCYARVYTEKHLSEHPEQKVAMISFGRSEYQAGGQIVNYDLHVQLNGQTEVYQGNAYCEASVEGFACGMEGDAGAVLVVPRAGDEILIVVHPVGVSFEGDSDVLRLSGRKGDDREFLLAAAPASDCQ